MTLLQSEIREEGAAAHRVQVPAEQRFVLSGINWPTYVAFGNLLGERHIRLTYDRGEMELMTVSPRHERSKSLLARLVEALTVELDIDIASYGSMTCRREDLERGLEPDECYWIANEPRVRGHDDIDFAEDPPPDLVLEVEISRSVLDRLGIYARLGVPEVWRWDGETLRICLLGPDGQYTESERSLAFPFLPVTELVRFLAASATMSETKLLRSFQAWVREQIARGWSTSA
jgi:Uma2 family endonuclease